MRRIIVGTFLSLDGVMQAPGGPEEDQTGQFEYGGWTVPYWDDVVAGAMGESFSKPFDLLLGRRTYDILLPTGRIRKRTPTPPALCPARVKSPECSTK